GAGGGEGSAPACVAGAAARAAGALQCRLRRPDPAGAVHRPRAAPGPGRRTLTIPAAGAHDRPGQSDRQRNPGAYRCRPHQFSVRFPGRFSGRHPDRGESLRLSQFTVPASQAGGKAVTLQFSDNTLLPLLLGDHDRHMVRIEQALGVRLSCRGNRVAIAGEPGRVDAAQAALEGLWRRLERGESVGRSDVEAAIRLSETETDPRLPLSDLPAIHTRRGVIGPRSAGQAAYMEALARHEMVFGV